MPHSNGKIYVDTSTTPNVGVSVYDVKEVLGETSNDVKTLCQSDNVNPWSKCKPVEPSISENVVTPIGLPSAGYANNRSYFTIKQNWGIAVQDENGVDITSALSIDDIEDRWEASGDPYFYAEAVVDNCSWVHERPTTVGRLSDFNGYDHKAVPFIHNNMASNTMNVYTLDPDATVGFNFFLTESATSISLSDMSGYAVGGTTIGDMYVAAFIDDSEGTVVFSSGKVNTYAGTDSIPFTFVLPSASTYNIWFCLSTANEWSAAADPRLFPLPQGEKLFTKITINVHQVDIFADMELVGISSVNISEGLSTVDLRTLTYKTPSYYDAYGDGNILYAPSGKGVVMKIQTVVGGGSITNFTPSLVKMSLNTGTLINAAVQIVGTNSTCYDHPSTSSSSSFTLVRDATYTFYVVATDVVADSVNEIQLSMTVSGHVNEGMSAATPWMNVYQS